MATATTETGLVDDWQGEKHLAECNLQMLKSENTCDVSFRVGQTEEIVRAHRYVLISRSCVFHSMLSGKWCEEDSVKIPDVSKDFFTEFLMYLYSDKCSLSADNVTSLLYLSKKYAVHTLHRLCLSFIENNLSPQNACTVLEQAHSFGEDDLFQQALRIITEKGGISLLTPAFLELCHSCLDKILASNDLDHYNKPEVVFDAVLSWSAAECSRQNKEVNPQNQREVLGESVYLIGFTVFNVDTFVMRVAPSRLLDDSECLKIIRKITCPENDAGPFRTPYRSSLEYEVRVYIYSAPPTRYEASRIRLNDVHDCLVLQCSQKIMLHGIVLTPADATCSITIKQLGTVKLSTTFTTTAESGKFTFYSPVVMAPHVGCVVVVKMDAGACPKLLMTGQTEVMDVYSRTFIYARRPVSGVLSKGIISGVIVS